jgi:hypothetical protein
MAIMLMLGVVGCGGKKPIGDGGGGGGGGGGGSGRGRQPVVSEEDKAKLDEARRAAENAERELSELRLERIQLESGQ